MDLLPLILGLIQGGTGLAGGLMAPKPKSFGGLASNYLQRGNLAATGMGRALNERVAQGVQLPGAFAQQPPVYTGGGLPMPIGVTGVDPALMDPTSNLTLPGIPDYDPFQSGHRATQLRNPAGAALTGQQGDDADSAKAALRMLGVNI